MFHIYLECFYYWLWTSKYLLGTIFPWWPVTLILSIAPCWIKFHGKLPSSLVNWSYGRRTWVDHTKESNPKLKNQMTLLLQIALNHLTANPTKWSNTIKQFIGKLQTNCLSVLDNFVGLALKDLIYPTSLIIYINLLTVRPSQPAFF